MKITTAFTALSLVLGSALTLQADFFGNETDKFEMEFVTIGNPGNFADTTGRPNPAGSVSYTYWIGKFEVSEQMVEKANSQASLGISLPGRGPDKPATISWFDAARFVNWLNTNSGRTPAYKFDTTGDFELWESEDAGYDPANVYRNALATYFLPDVHEWYKAAYYDPTGDLYYDYPTGSDTEPIGVASGTAEGTAIFGQPRESGPADVMLAGGPSPFGTVAQGGNVHEWNETDFHNINRDDSPRIWRGGDWTGSGLATSSCMRSASPSNSYGFRVASDGFPEPIRGDMNGDVFVNFGDLTPFAIALIDIASYHDMHPRVDRAAAGDVNMNGFFDFSDLNPFAELLTSNAFANGSRVPEPPSIVFFGCAAVLGGLRRRTCSA